MAVANRTVRLLGRRRVELNSGWYYQLQNWEVWSRPDLAAQVDLFAPLDDELEGRTRESAPPGLPCPPKTP